MKFPVDLLASVDPGALELSAKDCMSKLLYQSPEVKESLSLPDSKEIAIDLCNVSFMPLYGYDTEHKILGLYSREDIHTAVGLHLLGKWWSFEDILKTADTSRTGLLEVRTPVERIVLHVLNKFIYKAMEKASDEDPFLCHRQHQIGKILWKDGEAIGFYSFIPEGTLCDSFMTQHYQLPVMDTIFVRKLHRGKGYGLQMLEDFVHTFRNESVGLKYPLPAAMYKVCRSYLSTYPEDRQLLWEVHDVGALFQRTLISKKLQTMELKGLHQFVHKLNFETENTDVLMEKVIGTPAQKTVMEVVEEEVQFKITKEVNDTPVTTLGRSGNLKRKMLGRDTEATTEKTIRVEAIEAAIQSPVHETEALRRAMNLKETTTTVNRGVLKVVACVTCVHCGKHIEQTTESEEYVREVSALTRPTAELATLTLEKTASLQITSNIAEIQSMKSSEETQITESVEGSIGAADHQALQVQQLVEVEIGKMTSEKAMEKTELLQMTSNVAEIQSVKSSEETQITESVEGSIGTADLQALEVQQLVEVEIDKELTPGTKVIKERMGQAGGVKDGKDEGDDKISEKVICEVSSLQKSGHQTGLDLQPVTMGSEISQVGAEVQKEIDSEMNLLENGEESSVVSSVAPATEVEQHDTTQELLQTYHQVIAEETEESRNEKMEIDQGGVAKNESSVNVGVSIMEKENTEQIQEQELMEDTSIIHERKCEETKGIMKQRENNEEFKSDCAEPIEEKDSDSAGKAHSRTKHDEPLKETQTHKEIHGQLETDAIEDVSEPSHVHVGEESNNLTEPIEMERSDKPGTSGNHGDIRRSNSSTPVRRSGRFKDQSVEGELSKIVLRSGTKLTTSASVQKQVRHTKIVKQQESKGTEKEMEDASEMETPGDVTKIIIVEIQHGDVSKDEDQGRVAGCADTNQGIMEVTQEEEPLKETQTLEIHGQQTERVLRSGTKSVTAISKQKQVQHTKTVKQQEKKSIQSEDKSQMESAEMETVDITNVEHSTNLQDTVEEEKKSEEQHLETESTAEKHIKEVEDGSENKTIVTKIAAVDLDVAEVMNDGEIQVERKSTSQSDVELIEEQEKEPAPELAESEDRQNVVVVSSKETGEIEIATEKNVQSQEDQGQDLAKLANTEKDVEESKEKLKQTEVLIVLSEADQTDGNDEASAETIYSVEKHELQKVSIVEEMDVLAKESQVEPADKEQKDGNDDISAEIIHTEDTVSEEMDVLAAEPLVEQEEKIQEDESQKTSAKTMQSEEEDHLNKATVANEVDAFAEMGVKESMVQTLEKQVEDVGADNLARTDNSQEESMPVGEEIKDDTVVHVTLEEESVAAELHTSERATNQKEVQERLTSDNEVTVQKMSSEEGTPLITGRSLRQRTVTVQGSPQRKSKRFQKTMEIAEKEHVDLVEVTDKTDESRTEEKEENKDEKMETKDGTVSKDQDQGRVPGSADTDQDLMEVTQEETQILEDVQVQESSHVHIGEKSDIWTEPTEEQVSDKPGTSVTHGRSRKSNYSTPVRRSGRFKDLSVEGELTKIVLRSGTKLTTAISKHRQVRHTKTVKQQEKKPVQSEDESEVKQMEDVMGSHADAVDGADLQDSVTGQDSELEKECLETTNDSYLKEVAIRIEDDSQDETTGESIKITVAGGAEIGKHIEPEGEGETTESLMKPVEQIGGKETYAETIQPQHEEEELNKANLAEKEDAFTEIGVEEPTTEGLTERATEPSVDSLTKDSEVQEVIESDHGETVQENVPEEETPVITSRSLRQRTVMVTSTPQRSKSKHLQRTEVAWVTEEIKDSIAETDQSKAEKMEAELSSRSNDGDRAPGGPMEVVDEEEIVKVYTHQEITISESSQANETAVTDTYPAECVKTAGHTAQEELSAELVEQHHLEPVTEMALGEGGQKYTEEAVETVAPSKLQKASVVLVDFNKASSKQSAEISETSKETESVPHEEVNQEPDEPASTSRYEEEKTSDEDMLKQTDVCVVQAEKKQADEEAVVEIAENENVAMEDATSKLSEGENSAGKVDSNNEKMETEVVQGKDFESVISIVQELQGDTQEPRQVGDQEKLATQTEQAKVEHLIKRGKAHSRIKITESLAVGTPVRNADELTEEPTTSELTIRVLRSSTKQVQSTPNERSARQSKAMVRKDLSSQAVDVAEEEAKKKPTEFPTEIVMEDKIESISVTTEGTTVLQDMKLRVEDSHSGDEEMEELSIRTELFPEQDKDTEVLEEAKEATTGKDSEKDISTDQVIQGDTQEPGEVDEEEKSAPQIELVEAEHSRKRGKAHSTRKTTDRSALGTPVIHSKQLIDQPTTSELSQRVLRSCTKQVQGTPNQQSTQQTKTMVRKGKTAQAADKAEEEDKDKPTEVPTELAKEDKIETVIITPIEQREENSHPGDEEMEASDIRNELFPEQDKEDEVTTEDVVLKEATEATAEDEREKISDLHDTDIEIDDKVEDRTLIESLAETGKESEEAPVTAAEDNEGEKTESLVEPDEISVGENETCVETTQPLQEEEDEINKGSVAEKEDAFADAGVVEPMAEPLLEQAMEPDSGAYTLIIESGEQKQRMQTKDTVNTLGETSLNEESIAEVAKETVKVYTSGIPEVPEPDHGETVQEIVPEEVTPVVTSRSLRHRTVMVTSTPQRSKSKSKHLQKTEVAWVTEKTKDSIAETDQSKDEKMEAELSSTSDDGDRAPGGHIEAIDVSYTHQEIESSQAHETAVTDTYLTDFEKDAGHTAQDELPAELVEEHHLEPVTEMALGHSGQKDTEIAEEAVETVAPSKLQKASVVLVDFNKASSKQSAEISETSKETESVPQEEVNKELDEPASTSRNVEEKTSDEDMLKQTDVCVVQAENKQTDEQAVVEIAENENVAMDDATSKLSEGETSAGKVDSNNEKMETVEVQGKDLESATSIVQEIQGDTQEPRQVGEQEKLATQTELAEVEHSVKRGKAHSTRKTTESAVVTPVRHSEQHTEQTTTSELTIRVLRSCTKQVQSTPNERSTRETKAMVRKVRGSEAVGTAEEEDKEKPTELPTELAMEDKIEAISVTTEGTTVLQDIKLRVEDSHSGDEEMEVDIRTELFPEQDQVTDVLEEAKEATTGKDSEKDINTDQEKEANDTQEPSLVCEEVKSVTEIELDDMEHSRKRGKAHSTRKATERSVVGTPVRRSEHLKDQHTTSELTERALRSSTKQVQSTPNERSTRQTKEMVRKGKSVRAEDVAEEGDREKPTVVPTELPMEHTIEAVSVLIEGTAVLQDLKLRVEDSHSGDEEMEELSIRTELFPEQDKDTEVLEEAKEAATGKDSEKDISTDQVIQGDTQEPGEVDEEEKSAPQIELVEPEHSRKRGKAHSTRKTTDRSAVGTPVSHSEQFAEQPTTSELTQRVLRSCTKQVQSTPNQQSTQTKTMVQKSKTVQAVDKAEEEEEKDKPTEAPSELAKEDKIGTESITIIEQREENSDEEMETSDMRTKLFPEDEEDKVTTEDVVLKNVTEATAEDEREKVSDLHHTDIEKDVEVEDRTPLVSMAETGEEEEAPVPASESTSVVTVQKATVVLVDFKKVTSKQTNGIEASGESQNGDEQEQGSGIEALTKAKADDLDEQQKLVEIMVEKSITETLEEPSVEVGEYAILNTDSGHSDQEEVMLAQEKLIEEIILEEESTTTQVQKMVAVCSSTTETSQKESLTPDHRGNVLEEPPEEETPIILSRSLRKRIVTVSASPQRKTKRLPKHGLEANVDNEELEKTVDNVNIIEKATMEVEILEKTVEMHKEVGNKALISEEMLPEIPDEVEATTSTEEHQVPVVKTIELDDGHEYIENKDSGSMEGSHVQDLEEEKGLDKIHSGDDTSLTNVVVETTSLTKERIQREVEVSGKKNTQKTKMFSQKESTEYHLIKPAQEKSYEEYEESSDEDELIITKNLRQRLVIVESPMRRKSKRHNIAETHIEKAQPGIEKTALLVETSSQRETSTAVGIQITETQTNPKDGSEDQAQSIDEVMSKEVTTSEKQGSKNVTVIVVETEEPQNIGSTGRVEGAPEDNMEERTTERTIFEKVEVKDLTYFLQENVPDATSEQESGQPQQEQKVLNKAEELLIEEKSEGVPRRTVIGEEEQGKQHIEKGDIGNVSTTEEVFYESEEGAGDGRRLLRKRTITTTKRTKATIDRKSKRMCKESDVEHAGSSLSVEEQVTEQRIIELTAENDKEKEIEQTEKITVQDNDKNGGEMLSAKAKDHENPEGEETCGETNTSTSVRKETTKVTSITVEELSTKIEIKKGEKGEEKDCVTIVATVDETKELSEKNPVECSEIPLAPDESFILQLEEEDENNGPKETSVIEEMEVSLMGSSNLGSPSIQTTDKREEHTTQETEVEKEGKEAVKSKRVPKGRSSATVSLQQISPRLSKRFLQESELEGKSETVKEKAEKVITEEQSPLKRKAIADTPRRSKRLATPKSV